MPVPPWQIFEMTKSCEQILLFFLSFIHLSSCVLKYHTNENEKKARHRRYNAGHGRITRGRFGTFLPRRGIRSKWHIARSVCVAMEVQLPVVLT